MATPEDVRRARLEADYEEMKSIRGTAISWQAYGTPPHEYIVTFNIRSYINTSLTRDEHRIRIILSPSHPFEKPVVMMHEMVPIFQSSCLARWKGLYRWLGLSGRFRVFCSKNGETLSI
ncbi:MAG: hypothetical protein IPK14_05285 [Blastocatellia bacterium]|nr:hypothetical protein [Blastocatellia bacterium]